MQAPTKDEWPQKKFGCCLSLSSKTRRKIVASVTVASGIDGGALFTEDSEGRQAQIQHCIVSFVILLHLDSQSLHQLYRSVLNHPAFDVSP
jgi:hypothetical protein